MITKEEIKALLQKNKEKLVYELQQNEELLKLMTKSTYSKLTDIEKEKIKSQLLEVFKTIPAFAIFLLPGGMILLPLVAKLIPSIMPNIFKSDKN